MKPLKKCMCLLMVVGLLMYMATPALAAMVYGIYGMIYRSSIQSDNYIYSQTSVSQNPDRAYLLTYCDFSDGFHVFPTVSSQSERRATSYSVYLPIPAVEGEYYPDYYWCVHEVRGGTESPTAYAERTEGDLSY